MEKRPVFLRNLVLSLLYISWPIKKTPAEDDPFRCLSCFIIMVLRRKGHISLHQIGEVPASPHLL